MKTRLSFLALSLLLAACADKSAPPSSSASPSVAPAPAPATPTPTAPTSFDAMSPADLVRAKYDLLRVECAMDFDYTIRDNGNLTGQQTSESGVLDLLASSDLPQEISLRHEIDAAVVTATWSFTGLKVNRLSDYVDQNGAHFQMDYSPILAGSVTYDRQGKPGRLRTLFTRGTGHAPVALLENFQGAPLSSTADALSSDVRTEVTQELRLHCLLHAVPKPQYKNQIRKLN
jgi:hypothetical protein